MKNANITKTIFLIAILALMQIAAFAQKAELVVQAGHFSGVTKVAFSPIGQVIASSDWSGYVKLWDVVSGKLLKTFKGNSSSVISFSFSSDGKTLAVGDQVQIKIWDVVSGKNLKTFSGHSDLISSVVILPDGKTIASGSWDKTIKLWDINSGNELKTFVGHTEIIRSIAISPDGKTLVSGSDDQTIRFWDIASGNILKVVELSDEVFELAFSLNGKILASAGREDKAITLWGVATNQKIKTLLGHTDSICSLAFSTDGKTLASGSYDETVKLWDIETGAELRTLTEHNRTDVMGRYVSIAFLSDGNTLVSSDGRYKNINLWDVNSGKKLNVFSGNNIDRDSLESKSIELFNTLYGQKPKIYSKIREFGGIFVELNKTDHIEIYLGSNGELNIVELDKNTRRRGNLLARLIALDGNNWAVVDPDGRFDASPGAQKLMHFVVGLEPIDLEQIKDRYYTPNLLQRIFKGENLDATRRVSVFTADELYPLAEYAPLRANETVVSVKLQNRGGGIGRVQVFVNGAEFLTDARPKGFDPKSQSAELKIDFSAAKTLKRGEPNAVKIIARNEAGWLRNRGSEIVYLDNRQKTDAPPEFYAIIGGVSGYENASLNLRYSAKDARDFAKAVDLGAAKLFGKERVHIRLLASGAETENAGLTGADSKMLAPTKENFRKTFDEFRKAKPTDVFVVYLAGHGTSINKGGDTGDTYLYLTQEAVTTDKSRLLDEKLRGATTVSSEELAEWIREVPALKRAMILDTCAAGAVEASLTKARDLSPDQIKALDRMKDRTGFYVLMGSAADAQSYEATRYGQGLLTYSLLQGMSGAKLRDGEYADISSLFNYAEDTVTEMAKGIGGIQQPRIIAPTESRSFDIGQFSTAEKSKFTLAKVKPLILQPQLSNDKLKFDNLKLSQAVAKALRDESSTASRGAAEAKLVFVEAEEMNDAVTPSGVYEISGDQIKVTLVLVRNNEPVKTLTVEGGAADKDELSRKIVRVIIENAGN